MRIAHLTLSNFKRFTHLELIGIPASAKLVLLIGANGSGKSSVFDAFEFINSRSRGMSRDILDSVAYSETARQLRGHTVRDYYKKDEATDFSIAFEDEHRDLHRFEGDEASFVPSGSFYGRTSFRQIPRLTKTSLGTAAFNFGDDTDRPRQFIERDDRFENDVEHITGIILNEVFYTSDSTEKIRARYIDPINQAFERIFGNQNGTQLRLVEVTPPLEGRVAQINFTKGNSKIHYNLLSAGEKEVFNVLLNFLSRREMYKDTVFFFDELDLHLNTAIQSSFLAEITENWIPENCQLWAASHSLGFIDYAKRSDLAVILDFDNLDFDLPQTISPQAKHLVDIYEVAVPKSLLFEIFHGKRIVVCENKDDEFYNLLELPDTIFVGLKDSRDVFLHIKRDNRFTSLRDRDFLSDTEIERIQKHFPKHRILHYYNFENYLYHPDNIAEVSLEGFDKTAYVQEIVKQKNERADGYIIPGLKSSRKTYEEFNTDENLRDEDVASIVKDLQSPDFERFYKFFDMKTEFRRDYLKPFNLKKEVLASTKWFKNQIAALLA